MIVAPTTKLGKWSLGLGVLFFLSFFAILPIIVGIRQLGRLESPFTNFLLAIFGLVVMAVGLGAFLTGLFAIIRSKERAVLVFVTTAIGVLALLFVLGEFLFPH